MNRANNDRVLPFNCHYCDDGFQTNGPSSVNFTPREELVFLAKMSEHSCRYDEMACYITRVAELGKGLSFEERQLFTKAYQKIVTARKQSLKVVSKRFHDEVNSGNVTNAFDIKCLKERIEAEIQLVCTKVLNTLEKIFQPRNGRFGVSGVFYYKMKGDYHRYLAQYTKGNTRRTAIDNCKTAYKAAASISYSELSPLDPLRLGLLLNISTFYYDIIGSTTTAKRVVRSALKHSLAIFPFELDNKSKEALYLMQQLREYYVAWALVARDSSDLVFMRQDFFRVSPDK